MTIAAYCKLHGLKKRQVLNWVHRGFLQAEKREAVGSSQGWVWWVTDPVPPSQVPRKV